MNERSKEVNGSVNADGLGGGMKQHCVMIMILGMIPTLDLCVQLIGSHALCCVGWVSEKGL